MYVQLKPELEKFIDDQVKAGNFPTPDAAVAAAVEQMRTVHESEEIDDETADAINRAEEQIDRGEGINFRWSAEEVRRNLSV